MEQKMAQLAYPGAEQYRMQPALTTRAPVTEDTPPVARAVSSLESELGTLSDMLHSLEKRLAPVMVPAIPAPETAGGNLPPPGSPFAADLENLSRSTRRMQSAVSSILNRLEV